MLHDLYLAGNKLKALPDSFNQLQQLRWLDLSDNQFSEIPKSIEGLRSLEILSLNGNGFTQLSIDLGSMGRLRELSLPILSGKSLDTLIQQLRAMPQMRRLRLIGNLLPSESDREAIVQRLPGIKVEFVAGK